MCTLFFWFRMAEGGEHYHSSSDDDSDAALFDSDDEDDGADYGRQLHCLLGFSWKRRRIHLYSSGAHNDLLTNLYIYQLDCSCIQKWRLPTFIASATDKANATSVSASLSFTSLREKKREPGMEVRRRTLQIHNFMIFTPKKCPRHRTHGPAIMFKKLKICAVFLSSYRNTSESLGERAFSSSPKLSRVFL